MPPPPRRRPVPSTPSYRPKVAGLHKRPAERPAAENQEPVEPAAAAPSSKVTAPEPVVEDVPAGTDRVEPGEQGLADAPAQASPQVPDGTDRVEDPALAGHALPASDEVVPSRADDGPATTDRAGRALADPTDQVAAPTAPKPSPDVTAEDDPDATTDAAETKAAAPKPTGRGKRGSTRVPSPAPRALSDAKADAESDAADEADAGIVVTYVPGVGGDKTRSPLLLPLVLVVVAAVLAGLGFWFQTRSRDVSFNEALVDTGGTTEVSGQAREAVERAFSYNFADVAATESAANELLVGKAKCQYNAIFGPVKTLAPEQKLVVTVRVVSSGVTSLVGDRATVLLFIDQVTTRTTDNQTGGGIAMMRVGAQRSDGRWKVDNMEMFGQTGDQSAEMAKCADAK